MDLKDQKPSTNFQDVTLGEWIKTKMGQNLWHHMLNSNLALTPASGPPGGYSNWLTDAFNQIDPGETEIMRKHGLSINDILRFDRYSESNGTRINPKVFPYSDDAILDAARRMNRYR